MMMPDLIPASLRISHMGVLKSCIARLGPQIPDPLLYGASGYAFMMNIAPGVHYAGPASWNTTSIAERMPNIGLTTESFIVTWATQPDFQRKHQLASAFIAERLSKGLPCYGCELAYPGYFTINDYDTNGFTYQFTSPVDGEVQPIQRAWSELGRVDMGLLLVGGIELSDLANDNIRTIRETFRFAIDLRDQPPETFGAQSTGLGAFDAWMTSLQDGSILQNPMCHPHGTVHNALAWQECRQQAVGFLQMAAPCVDPSLHGSLANAASQYNIVQSELGRVAQIFIQTAQMPDPARRRLPPPSRSFRTHGLPKRKLFAT